MNLIIIMIQEKYRVIKESGPIMLLSVFVFD